MSLSSWAIVKKNRGDEPVGADGGDDLRFHDFHRDLAIVPEVVRKIDGRHAARTQHLVDPVLTGKSFREGLRGRAHVLAGGSHPAAGG